MLLALLPAAGCVSPHRTVVTDVDPAGGWKEAALRFVNDDTLGRYDLRFVVRYDRTLGGRILDWDVTFESPDSLSFTERFAFRPEPARGPVSLLCDTAVCYRRDVVLRRRGDYALIVRPRTSVAGVHAVGIDLAAAESSVGGADPPSAE